VYHSRIEAAVRAMETGASREMVAKHMLRKENAPTKSIYTAINTVGSKNMLFYSATPEIAALKKLGFDGQIFDSYKFLSDIIRTADKSIVLIDNYIDDSVLTLFSKRNKNVQVTIFTKEISKQLSLDLAKYNSQYPLIEVKEFQQSHDRFLIIDNREVYHIGASLKDLGKKWFAFSKFDKEAFNLLDKLGLK